MARIHSSIAVAGLWLVSAFACAANLQVQVLGPEEFPWRPALDYERKFDYLAAAPV